MCKSEFIRAVKKISALILSAALAMLTACGNSAAYGTADTTAQGINGQTLKATSDPAGRYVREQLTVGVSADAGTLDPFLNNRWGSVMISYYQTLATTDSTGKLYKVILKDWKQVDERSYELNIWDCVHDSEGNSITIDDVIWSYEHLTELGHGGGIRKIDSFEKTGEYSCIMHLSDSLSTGDLEKYLSNANIVSRAAYEAAGDMNEKATGTGPYKVTEYTPGTGVTFEADENWWFLDVKDQISDYETAPECRQNFRKIRFDIIPEASSRAIALETGAVDVVDSLDQTDINTLAANENFRMIDMPVTPPVAFVMNASEESPLKSKALRKALCYAIDNAAFAEGMDLSARECYGLQPNALDAPESWRSGEGRSWYRYDKERAKQLIEASGYKNETLTLMYESSVAFDAAALLLVSAFAEVGLSVELKSVEHMYYENAMYKDTEWDLRLLTMGGGMYLSQLVKGYWSGDDTEHIPDLNYSLVPDETLDELFLNLMDDNSAENIEAWDEYFEEQAYAYAICTYSTKTACRADLECNYISERSFIYVSAMTNAE